MKVKDFLLKDYITISNSKLKLIVITEFRGRIAVLFQNSVSIICEFFQVVFCFGKIFAGFLRDSVHYKGS